MFVLSVFSVYFFMLDVMVVGIGILFVSVCNFIVIKYRSNVILFFFVVVNLGFFVYEWFVLEYSWIIFIVYVLLFIFIVGFLVICNMYIIRKVFFVVEILGLLYVIFVGSIFGMVFNVSNLISILSKLCKF